MIALDAARADAPGAPLAITCERMTRSSRTDAFALLASFLREDSHYLASSAAYGDGGVPALERALGLFLGHPELGFVWLAYETTPRGRTAAGACVVCFAISTSRGAMVAKLDDVNVRAERLGQGVGSAMLRALELELERCGVKRIDTACHRGNHAAWRFYERLGFRPLDEERLALLLD